jgi:hypothetical protein
MYLITVNVLDLDGPIVDCPQTEILYKHQTRESAAALHNGPLQLQLIVVHMVVQKLW